MGTATNVIREIGKNAAMSIRPIADWRINRPRVGAQTVTIATLDRYAFEMVRGVEGVIGSVEGKDIVEFGPGDTLGAGFAALAAGARSYAALDRFVPDYSSESAKAWYSAIRNSWDRAFPGRTWPPELEPTRFPEAYPDRASHSGGGVEDASTDKRYDVVTSWQVGEHVDDVPSFCSLTASLLRPEGTAIHRVDFGPHDCWRRETDPRRFMQFSTALWRAMGSHRGYPNRVRHATFVREFEAAGLSVEVTSVRLFNPDEGETSTNIRDAVYICRHV